MARWVPCRFWFLGSAFFLTVVVLLAAWTVDSAATVGTETGCCIYSGRLVGGLVGVG